MENTCECQELKNIKYNTMLLNGVPMHETKSSNDLSNLEKYLESEKSNNVNDPWCKLNKTIKSKKLQEFVEQYKAQHNMSDDEAATMLTFLKDCVDRKKLQRVKDVIYDKTTGVIKDIPGLQYVKLTKHFTLKNVDKRVSTLKSLTPKKGTIRKKDETKQVDSDEDDDA